jgi:hypothetical protein
MIFKVARTTDAEWETAPYLVLRDAEVFLEGIQEQSEAQALCDLLNAPPLKVVPMIGPQPRWLSGGRGGRHLAP